MSAGEDPRIQLGPQLTGSAADACREALDEIRPIIRTAPHAHPASARAAAGLAHLLGRLHPHTTVDGDAKLGQNPWQAPTIAAAVEQIPRAEPSCQPKRDVTIAIGDLAGDWHIGGDDWTMVLSDSATAATPTRTGLGLQVAACFAAAEMLKLALGPHGLICNSALPNLVWNLVDYRLQPAPAHDERWRTPPPLAIFGAGSVGSSVAAHLVGDIPASEVDIVDGDSFDPRRNPYRYPASTIDTTGPKADWLAGMLHSAGWKADPHADNVASWVTRRDGPAFAGIAISSVDRVDSRADVADALAAMTLSVGVNGLAFHIQRERPADDLACPFCQYLHVGSPLSNVEAIGGQVGLPVARVAVLLAGDRLTSEDVIAAVRAGCIEADSAEALVGRRIEDLIRRAYAEASIQIVPGAAITVSAPAVSWLAGALVAAEVAKLASSLPLLDRRVDLDMSGIPTGATRQLPRDTSGRCLCASPFRRRAVLDLPNLSESAT